MAPIEVFFSYAHEDDAFRQRLLKQLIALKREGIIDIWNDCDINAGSDWEQEINEHLNTAQIILLLISPDFMASHYCYSREMQRAMERHRAKEALVIPVILRSVYWKGAPFGRLQALPKNGKPVTDSFWYNLDRAFFDVAEGIREASMELLTKQLLDDGKALYAQNRYEEALTVFQHITHINPYCMEAYNWVLFIMAKEI
jgi:tetratricopeptide (TPR) repeat protein